MLQLGPCRLDVAARTLMMVDSLDMTDADRKVVLQNCRSAAEERINLGSALSFVQALPHASSSP